MVLNFTKMKTLKNLEVINVRYYETRRGIGYEAKTNVKGISIWNDGQGGGTYLDYNKDTTDFKLLNEYKNVYERLYSEQYLEKLIDTYEGLAEIQ